MDGTLAPQGKTGTYLELMLEEKSLDAIKDLLHINKKSAFDRRHKILSSVAEVDRQNFQGVTESDETFFRFSEKGKRHKDKNNKLPKRRQQSKEGGKDQVRVIVTQDRNKEVDLAVSGSGRLTKADIRTSIGERINIAAILCSDSHVSYKGLTKDKNIEHHALRSDMQQHLKEKKSYPARQPQAQPLREMDRLQVLGCIHKVSAVIPQLVSIKGFN